MTDWIEQYSAAIDERDEREQAHKTYIDAYTKLADRTASLNSKRTITASSPPPPSEAGGTSTSPTGNVYSNVSVSGKAKLTLGNTYPTEAEKKQAEDLITTLRTDLASTQKARTALQTQVSDLTTSLKTLELQAKATSTQIAQLTRQKTDVERKLRDREEEIKGKSKLVVEAQDEMVALGLQLNMAEQKSEKLGRDNAELLERWMRLKGEEAERMNRDSRWL